jgi:hypothetical protein
MAIVQIPPSNHIKGSLTRVISNVSKVTKSTLDRVMTGNIVITISPSTTILDMVTSSLINYIEVDGKAPEAQRRLSKGWRQIVTKAIAVDFMRAYQLAETVQDDSSYSWTTVREAYGSIKATRMSNLLFEILSYNTSGFQVAGTGYRFFFTFRLEIGTDQYETWAKKILQDEFETLKSTKYRSAQYYGILAALKSYVVKDLYLETPQPTLGTISPKCIGDVLFNENSKIDVESLGQSTYSILHSEGVSPMSMAFNIFYNTKLSNPTVIGIDIIQYVYFKATGSPKVEVLELLTNVAFGISYTEGEMLPDNINPFGNPGSDNPNNGPDKTDPTQGPSSEPDSPSDSESESPSGDSGPSDSPPQSSAQARTFTSEDLGKDKPPVSKNINSSTEKEIVGNVSNLLGEELTEQVSQIVHAQIQKSPNIRQKTLINKVLTRIPGVASSIVNNAIPIAVSALYLSDRNRTLEGNTTNTSLGLSIKGPNISRTTTKTILKPTKGISK